MLVSEFLKIECKENTPTEEKMCILEKQVDKARVALFYIANSWLNTANEMKGRAKRCLEELEFYDERLIKIEKTIDK